MDWTNNLNSLLDGGQRIDDLLGAVAKAMEIAGAAGAGPDHFADLYTIHQVLLLLRSEHGFFKPGNSFED